MSKHYCRFTEKEMYSIFADSAENIEYAVNAALKEGYELVGVSYVGGCRASGYHVYHFLY